jgi:hypothetical protein
MGRRLRSISFVSILVSRHNSDVFSGFFCALRSGSNLEIKFGENIRDGSVGIELN